MLAPKDFPQTDIVFIATSIIEVINHLTEKQQLHKEPSMPQTDAANPFNLLLIGNTSVTQAINTVLNNDQPYQSATITSNNMDKAKNNSPSTPIKITSLSSDDFIKMQFDNRYDLGCFIDSSFLSIEHLTPTQYTTIATRLRDLFAKYSLIFTDTKTSTHKLIHSLGYQIADITPYSDASSNIKCWQFNLYDYKKTPDWLNSRFWANPENFDKYRW